ncbi:MAG: response regulator, partial [Deltaproteobacteria bacterium]|nr:response regulator [Deltaproteobacteria bacterium]
ADHNGHVTRVNAALLDMLGYEEDDMVGAYVGKFVPSQTGIYRSAAGDEVQIDEAYLKQNVQRSAELFQKGRGTNWESYVIHKSGTLVPVESSHMLIGGEQGGAARAVGICRDITGRRLAEKEKAHLAGQIQQTRKMESIATLAGGIAHDFNNLLLGITGNLELMKMKVPATAAARPYIELIQNAAGNMADLTNQLLAYARGGKYFVDKIDLNHLISNALYFMQENEEADISFQAELSPESPCVEADSTQIQMLVSAVVSNAVEACEGTGVISISTDCLQQRDCADRYPQLTPGSYVCVTVEDNGRGMTPEERSKMFEPFYTTKMQGRGLGMAAVYGIIKNHGGDICVDSVAGRGTCVSICLPVAPSAPVKNNEPAAVQDKVAATVLIVEDEETIMELTTEFLEQEGYVVLKAATGKQALEMSDSYSGHIDIALLDIGLPDMSGAKLFPVLIEKRPDLKVIVCSGYSPDDPVQQSLKTEVKGFVQKPYPLKTLRQKIHDLLVVQ